MAVWEKAKLRARTPDSRIDVDNTGASWVRILSPKFRLNDGTDYTKVEFGNQLIDGGVE